MWADMGYQGKDLKDYVKREYGIDIEIVKRPPCRFWVHKDTPLELLPQRDPGFSVQPRRNDGTNDSQVVNVYSSRKEELVRTLFDEFTKNTGIKVRYIIDDYSQLLSRMENGGEADLFLTADAINLILAKKRGLLSQVDSEVLKSVIPARFRDSEDYWFGLTKRARILVYNKESVDPKDLSTYEDLANEKWKGKILVRSSTSPYNRSLIAFMIANNGFEKTKEWVRGIVSNMARKPSGGDTDQIYAVAAENKKNVADKLGALFPNRNDHGVMVNISGAAVTKNAKNRENAIVLLEFLVSKHAQELYAKKNQEYPIIEGVETSDILKSWGNYSQSDLPLSELEKYLFEAVMVADEYQGRVLVVAPTSILSNWQREMERFAPELKLFVYHGQNRELASDYDVALTSYGLARRDKKELNKIRWFLLVIDEAQNIKNPNTEQTKAIKAIEATHRIAMSGTPVENRLKSDKSIIQDLPDKIENNRYCSLTSEQTALYQKVVDTTMEKIEESEGIERKGLIFKLINALKQICNHPSQFGKKKRASIEQSGKMQMLEEILISIGEVAEKSLIFTQYTEMGEIIARLLEERFESKVPFLHGGLSRKARDEMVNDFQNLFQSNILIVSLKAGGTGLNLTAANHVIHYDLWWNPAVEAQLTDRAYRIGQERNVMVYRLLSTGTFEERIDEMIQSKKELANLTISSGDSWITEFNRSIKRLS
uniref:Uncharacterized protein n=2 Tax=cellular organisms TaxID=131567 RepID=A0A1B0FCI3_GLOMM